MTKSTRPKSPTFTSPKGTFKFPKLNEPDYKFKKEGEMGTKVVFLASDPDVQAFIAKLAPLHARAVELGEIAFNALPVGTRKAFAAKKVTGAVINPLYSEVFDEDTEQPTGEIEFKFSMAAIGEIKNGKNAGAIFVRRPSLFDAKGKMLVQGFPFHIVEKAETVAGLLSKRGPAIWGGTVGKVSLEVGINAEGEPGYFIPGTAACGLSLKPLAVQIITLVQGGGKNAEGYGFGQEEGYEGGEPGEDEGAIPSSAGDGSAAAGDQSDF